MDYKNIKKGETYQTRSMGQIVKVKVTNKVKKENFYKLEYEYITENLFGFTKGWQFSETTDFPNINAVD